MRTATPAACATVWASSSSANATTSDSNFTRCSVMCRLRHSSATPAVNTETIAHVLASHVLCRRLSAADAPTGALPGDALPGAPTCSVGLPISVAAPRKRCFAAHASLTHRAWPSSGAEDAGSTRASRAGDWPSADDTMLGMNTASQWNSHAQSLTQRNPAALMKRTTSA